MAVEALRVIGRPKRVDGGGGQQARDDRLEGACAIGEDEGVDHLVAVRGLDDEHVADLDVRHRGVET